MTKFTSIIFCFLIALSLQGQDLSLLHMRHIGASNSTNPALKIDSATWVLDFLNISEELQYNSTSYNSIVQSNSDRLVADVNYALQQLSPTGNNFNVFGEVETMRLQYHGPKWSVQLHHANRFQANLDYPKALAELAWLGNASRIGERVEIGPSFDFLSYSELGIGGSIPLGKFRLGVTLNILAGNAIVETNKAAASLYTSDDVYQLSLTTDYEINTADLATENELFDLGLVALDFSNTSLLNPDVPTFNTSIGSGLNSFFTADNRGIGLDIGITYELNEQWQFGWSVVDLGLINWKNNTASYTSKETTNFNGLDIGVIDFDDTASINFESLKDSLEQFIAFEQKAETFTTHLPVQSYLSAHYQLSSKLEFGAVLYGQFGAHETFGASLSANYKLPFIRLGAVYSIVEDHPFNMGLNATIELGALRLYAMTNNVVTLVSPLSVTSQANRVGVGFVF